mmetsp:Transcript_26881/g.72641  ORF Transcript_26881/g.72641 Transcript_26881/m.72641 type:complete len:257 (-) Transcript_26881:308-1078(-)
MRAHPWPSGAGEGRKAVETSKQGSQQQSVAVELQACSGVSPLHLSPLRSRRRPHQRKVRAKRPKPGAHLQHQILPGHLSSMHLQHSNQRLQKHRRQHPVLSLLQNPQMVQGRKRPSSPNSSLSRCRKRSSFSSWSRSESRSKSRSSRQASTASSRRTHQSRRQRQQRQQACSKTRPHLPQPWKRPDKSSARQQHPSPAPALLPKLEGLQQRQLFAPKAAPAQMRARSAQSPLPQHQGQQEQLLQLLVALLLAALLF